MGLGDPGERIVCRSMNTSPKEVAQEVLAELYLVHEDLEILPSHPVLDRVKDRVEKVARLTRDVIETLPAERD